MTEIFRQLFSLIGTNWKGEYQMEKVKIVQIGVSHDHARDIFESLLALEDMFEVIGYVVCDNEEVFFSHLSSDNVFSRSTQMCLEEALSYPGLEAVTIECGEQDLTKYATLAAKKGLHVHMDKPGSADTKAFQVLANICKTQNLTFHIGYMYRYNPAVQKVMEIVKSGNLGRIYSIEAQMSCLLSKQKRQWLTAFDGGMMFYLGCHLIDLIISLQGLPNAVVPLNKKSGFDDVAAEDISMVVFHFDNGISFARSNATEAGGGVRRQLVVLGENGSLELRPIERWIINGDSRNNIISEMREIYKDEAIRGGGMCMPKKTVIGPFNRYDSMMTAFAGMVRETVENRYTYAHEVKLHEILMQACGRRN